MTEKRLSEEPYLYRTLVTVVGVSGEPQDRIVEAIVLGWDPHQVVRFSSSLLPKEISESLREDQVLLAKVNLGAENQDELKLSDFEIAPDPDPEDGLA